MGPRRRIPGCLKLGCGCAAGLVVFLALAAGLIALWVVREDQRPVRVERTDAEHALPPAAVAPASGELGAAWLAPRAGRLVLDLSMGRFLIVPGPPDQPIRVEAELDRQTYELEERFEPGAEGRGWTYSVRFHRRGWLGRVVAHDAPENVVRIVVPRGVPLAIEGRIGVGASEFELGGLWITTTDLQLGVGDHRVSFSEPAPVPMESFHLAASIGELRVDRLGQASPAEVEVRHRVGEVRVDLGGRWVRDARVHIRGGIGELRIGLPAEAGWRLAASASLGEAGDAPAARPPPAPGGPTLDISASTWIGELGFVPP